MNDPSRRRLLLAALACAAGTDALARDPAHGRAMQRALEMRQRALASGDQPYGAVVVCDGKVVGEAPSRVVVKGDPAAHAEREAIADAQRRLGASVLERCELVSTSRPCALCERAARAAGISRMIHG